MKNIKALNLLSKGLALEWNERLCFSSLYKLILLLSTAYIQILIYFILPFIDFLMLFGFSANLFCFLLKIWIFLKSSRGYESSDTFASKWVSLWFFIIILWWSFKWDTSFGLPSYPDFSVHHSFQYSENFGKGLLWIPYLTCGSNCSTLFYFWNSSFITQPHKSVFSIFKSLFCIVVINSFCFSFLHII